MIRKIVVALVVAIMVVTAGLAIAQPPSGGNGIPAKIAAVESAIAGVLQRLGVLESAGTNQNARLAALESSQASLTTRLGTFESTVAAQALAIGSLQSSLSSLTTRVGTLESTVAAQAVTIGNLQSRLASVEAVASNHETRLNALEGTTLTVGFEEPVDLETGQVCQDPFCFGAQWDFRFAFNSTRPNPTVVFQEGGAQLALLIGTPYAAVSSTAGLVFTGSIIDVPFGPNDTAVIQTAAGHFFKIGQAVCAINNLPAYPGCTGTGNGVTFRFTQIH